MALGLLLLWRLAQFAVGTAGAGWAYDFAAYWLAGRHVLEGQPLYSAAQLAGIYPPQQPLLFLYPPFFAVTMAPLSALFAEPRTAMWLWAAIGLAALLAAVWVVGRAEHLPAAVIVLLLGAMLALPPVGFELVMGNVHLVLVALFAVTWAGIKSGTRRGEAVAGAMVGTAALIKIFPIVLVLWFLLTRRHVATLSAVVAAGALAAATLPIVGIDAWLDFPRALANLGPPVELWSSLAPMSLLAEFIDFGVARLIAVTVGVAILAWSALRQATPISFSVAIMISLLIVPTLYPHYLAVVVVPLLLMASHSTTGVGPSLAYGALLLGGQMALIDLRPVLFRALALLSTLVPLAALLADRRPREPATTVTRSVG